MHSQRKLYQVCTGKKYIIYIDICVLCLRSYTLKFSCGVSNLYQILLTQFLFCSTELEIIHDVKLFLKTPTRIISQDTMGVDK